MISLIVMSLLGIVAMMGNRIPRFLLRPILIVGCLLSAGLLWIDPIQFGQSMFVFDHNAQSFGTLICVLTALILTLPPIEDQHSDPLALLIFSAVGGLVMTSFTHFVMLFLGIEILSIPLYVLAAGHKKDRASQEAGLKYFVLGAVSSAFLLFGMALLYAKTGHLDLLGLTASVKELAPSMVLMAGFVFILAGLGFKVGSAPFHFWTPDVYQGAPTPYTAFMATVVKTAAVAALFKICIAFMGPFNLKWELVTGFLAVLSLIVGNFLALHQTSIKRFFAYSSIAHVGYLMLLVVVLTVPTTQLAFFYTLVYATASMGVFLVLTTLKTESDTTLVVTQGLFRRSPLLGALMFLSLMTLASLPPFPGFLAKYIVFAQLMVNGYLALTLFAVFTALIGVYYYFKLIVGLFKPSENTQPLDLSLSIQIIAVILMMAIAVLGFFPSLFI